MGRWVGKGTGFFEHTSLRRRKRRNESHQLHGFREWDRSHQIRCQRKWGFLEDSDSSSFLDDIAGHGCLVASHNKVKFRAGDVSVKLEFPWLTEIQVSRKLQFHENSSIWKTSHVISRKFKSGDRSSWKTQKRRKKTNILKVKSRLDFLKSSCNNKTLRAIKNGAKGSRSGVLHQGSKFAVFL